MQTDPSISIPNIYTPTGTALVGGLLNQPDIEPEQPAVMINLYIELMLDSEDNQKQIEHDFLKKLLAFSKTDKKMKISLVREPRDYQDYEVIKIS